MVFYKTRKKTSHTIMTSEWASKVKRKGGKKSGGKMSSGNHFRNVIFEISRGNFCWKCHRKRIALWLSIGICLEFTIQCQHVWVIVFHLVYWLQNNILWVIVRMIKISYTWQIKGTTNFKSNEKGIIVYYRDCCILRCKA